jgi:hypothetical protein
MFVSVVSISVKNIETNRKKNFGFAKKQTEKQPKQIEFRFKPRKKNFGFEDPLIKNVFWRFFWFVSVCFKKILFVSVVSIPVRNTKTNRKKCFLVSRNKPKNNRNRLSFSLFRFEPKIFFIVSRTP